MRDELVAIDLETTGLDPAHDDIIEVGAVRLVNGQIVDEFSTMVDPGRPIPSQTTFITGIQQDDVAGAPKIEKVLPQIAAFVGSAPVIAHNISLDMGFLQDRHRILMTNGRIDTYDLASVLLPSAPRYNLNSLTQQLGIDLQNVHRALADARGAALLYWELWQKSLSLPRNVLEEIIRASSGLNWDSAVVFQAALRESREASFDTATASRLSDSTSQTQGHFELTDSSDLTLLDPGEIADIFSEGGLLSQKLTDFEFRLQQQSMADIVTESFNKRQHLMIEAGTGTGKSMAYLVPALLWAVRNKQRVLISTNTINLQDQLINNDIPLVKRVLGIELEAAVMKGRSNYLSPQRLENMRRRGPASLVELLTYAKILVWQLENTTGDRSSITLRGPAENSVWNQLSAENEDHDITGSPFQMARRAAERAQIVVVNHALLVSDAISENRVLPDYRYAIIDEAHHFEDAVTQGLTTLIDKPLIKRRLAALGGTDRGLLGEILTSVKRLAPQQDASRLAQFIEGIGEAARLMEVHIDRLFSKAARFIEDTGAARPGDYMTLLRINNNHRDRASFAEIHTTWSTLKEFFEVISDAMRRLNRAIHRLNLERNNPLEELATNATSVAHQLEEIANHLQAFLAEPAPGTIYWIKTMQGEDSPTLQSAPLNIGAMVEKSLWNTKHAIIMTSATLRTNDNFEFIRGRLYADHVRTHEVGSVFNYRESTLVYLPNDIPEPSDRTGYQRAVEKAVIELAAALDGRLMVLFTSYTQLRQTAQAVTPRLALGNITVYDQSDGTSRESLLDGFKATEKAVLLGTRSFWEGVDIPGESLSALIITKLPFAVPTDPIFSGRSEVYEDSFQEYALPDAILRFRQGFGRLIRRKTDRGIVVVMDRRILSKRYGAQFLDSLPDPTIREGRLDDVTQAAKNWLAQEQLKE